MGHLWVKKDEIESDMKSAQKKENDVKKMIITLRCLVYIKKLKKNVTKKIITIFLTS